MHDELKDREVVNGALRALAFFDIFDHPLTDHELYRFLDTGIDFERCRVIFKNNLDSDNTLFFLKGRNQIVKTRKTQEVLGARLWKKVCEYEYFFRVIPFVKMAAVCNNLAFNTANTGSDIDLFIIAGGGRIFTVKFLATILYQILGVRRHGKKVEGRFCLSFFLSEDYLSLDSIRCKNDVYLDYWLATLKPVYGQEMMNKMILNNRITYEKFPNLDIGINGRRNRNSLIRRIGELLLGGKFGERVEKVLKSRQLKRYQKRQKSLGETSSVVVNDQMLKFHNNDRRNQYRDEYLKRLKLLAI